MDTLKIATYNIHKCVGMDRRYSPERIVDVLREIDADVIALQEVVCHSNLYRRDHQAEFIAGELGLNFCLGENRKHKGADYGNAILSRFPIGMHRNFDISIKPYEPRGCLWAKIVDDDGKFVHFLNVHMGTSFFERRKQVYKILADHVLEHPDLRRRRMVVGDFNEWISGLATKLFRTQFNTIDPVLNRNAGPTFPSILPVLRLDHVYFDDSFTLKTAAPHRSRAALVASDHLPVVAEFDI
jgi:endonuclease/exonuclease/phosphatase family metal-dependent hydrolase